MISQPPEYLRSFGRKRARKLTAHKEELQQEVLPRLRATLPEENGKISPASLFDKAYHSYMIEIGFGGGEHLAAQAMAHPGIGFIGCEPFIDGVMKLVTEVEERGLSNIRIHDDDARILLERLKDASLDKVFILFPDPWPKTKHHKRRIVNPHMLALLARVLKPGAELQLASDHADYVEWMLLQLQDHPSFEWLAGRPEDFEREPEGWIKTRYQKKAEKQGIPITFLRFRRR